MHLREPSIRRCRILALGQESPEHGGKHAAVISISLLRYVAHNNEGPLGYHGGRVSQALFCSRVGQPELQPFQVLPPIIIEVAAQQRFIVINVLTSQVYDSEGPVRVIQMQRYQNQLRVPKDVVHAGAAE